MKLLIVGDLHGRKPRIRSKVFDVIVLVGDVCDDRKIGPLYKKYFALMKNSDLEIDFEEFVNKKMGKGALEKYEKESVNVGNKILKYLDSFDKPIFMVGGNWDQSYGKTNIKNVDKNDYNRLRYFYDSWLGDKLNEILIKGTKNVRNCMYKVHEFKGLNFAGYGLSSAPESMKLRTKRKKLDISNLNEKQKNKLKEAHDKIVKKLYYVYKNRKDKKLPTIFITHNIPYKTKLDKIKDKKSYAYNKHLGSTVARNFCKKFQPIICVGGHIHEGKGKDKIGKTLVINPGYGAKAQVFIEIDDLKKKIISLKFLK